MQLLTEVRSEGEWLTGVLDPLRPESCKGHFPMFPALPVSILMHSLSDLGGRLLAQRIGDDGLRYLVRRALVRADNLAFAGERVEFRARHAESVDDAHVFECEATGAGGKSVGSLRLTLVAHHQRNSIS